MRKFKAETPYGLFETTSHLPLKACIVYLFGPDLQPEIRFRYASWTSNPKRAKYLAKANTPTGFAYGADGWEMFPCEEVK